MEVSNVKIEETSNKYEDSDINSEPLYKFLNPKLNFTNNNEINTFKFIQSFIKVDQIKFQKKCNFIEESYENPSKNTMIIPNKIKCLDNFVFFNYCELENKHLNEKKSDKMNLKIKEFYFVIYKLDSTTITENTIKINSRDLGYSIPLGENYKSVNNYKNFSNFYVRRLKNSFIIFLVIFNYICILQFSPTKINAEILKDVDKEAKCFNFNIQNYKIIFQKEFTDMSMLLYLGHEIIGNLHKFYILTKPFRKIVTLTCTFSFKKGIYKVDLDEIILDNIPEFSIKKDTSQPLSLDKVIVSNSPEIIFFDKQSNKIYLINKENIFKVRNLKDKSNELNALKNFLILTDNFQKFKQLYLITDEIYNNCLIIKLWKIYNLNNELTHSDSNLESVNCEKIQSLTIQLENPEKVLGLYNFTSIDDSNFVVCFYDYDEIFHFSLKNNNNYNQSNLYIEKITELRFEELFAFIFDYQIVSNKLMLTLYQEGEFIKYEIDINKGNMKSETESSPLFKNNSNFESKSISNKNSNKSVDLINTDAKNFLHETNKVKSKEFKIKDFIKKDSNDNKEDSKNSLNDLKKSISDNILNGLDEKIDFILNSKFEKFTDNFNTKLRDVFSFMKTQTEELDGIRKKNNESMIKLTNLILKSQEKTKNNNNNASSIPNTYSMTNHTNQNQNFNKNMGMMNLYNQQLLKQNPVQMQMQMNMNMPNIRPKWGYPFHLYPSEYLANSVNNFKIGYNQNNSNLLPPNFSNQFNQANFLLQNNPYFNKDINSNQMINNINSKEREIPSDNKYKEDEIIFENLEKKFSETNRDEVNNFDFNLTLDLNNENNKYEVNYSSDISSGNLESDVKVENIDNDIPKEEIKENNLIGSGKNQINKGNRSDLITSNFNLYNAVNSILFHSQLHTPPVDNTNSNKVKKRISTSNQNDFNNKKVLSNNSGKTKKKKTLKKDNI